LSESARLKGKLIRQKHAPVLNTGDDSVASQATSLRPDKHPAPAPPFENVLYEKKAGIAYVTLNSPKVL
jgi:hypothetical protein